MMPSWDMMQACSPNVAPQTTAAIIQVESGGNPFAIGVNGPIKNRLQPKNAQQAAIVARYYLLQGHTVDLGLMQINSSNLPGLGYTLEQMFDPCINMQAGGRILSRGYHGAIKRYGEGQNALKAALSAYNTGNYEHGFRNGYVVKYYRRAPLSMAKKYSATQRQDNVFRLFRPARKSLSPYATAYQPIQNQPLTTTLRQPYKNTSTTIYTDYQEDSPWNINSQKSLAP